MSYPVTYSPHHTRYPHGHVYIDKPGACTITLEGAASMSQEELDFYGEAIAKALKKIKIPTKYLQAK